MRANVAALRAGAGPDHFLRRYAEIGSLLAGPHPSASADIDAASPGSPRWSGRSASPASAPYGVTPAAVPDRSRAARQSSSMRGNPVVLGDDALAAALIAAL
jgi:hypothetical protein